MSEARDPLQEAADRRLAEVEAIVHDLGAAIERIERERRKVRPEDWDTLFRQMRAALEALGTHPFLAGDLHAEMLLSRMTAAADLEEFDKRVDALGDYVAGKLAYNATLKALREGREPDPAELQPRRFGGTAPGAARVVAQFGPSGSDFELTGEPAGPKARRGILRL